MRLGSNRYTDTEYLYKLGQEAAKKSQKDTQAFNVQNGLQGIRLDDPKLLLIGKLISAIRTLEDRVDYLEERLSNFGRNP